MLGEPATAETGAAAPDIRRSPSRQTETPEFKKWFGDSKVMDADGEPLVVYRGDTKLVTEYKREIGAGKVNRVADAAHTTLMVVEFQRWWRAQGRGGSNGP